MSKRTLTRCPSSPMPRQLVLRCLTPCLETFLFGMAVCFPAHCSPAFVPELRRAHCGFQVCPAGWTPGSVTMKPTPKDSKDYFAAL